MSSVEEFLKSPSSEYLDGLRKTDLIYLVAKGIFEDSECKPISENTEIRELELQYETRLKLRLKEMELEYDLRLKELEFNSNRHRDTDFDVTKHIRLVPAFNEKEIDKYFLLFEKVAVSLNWQKQFWPLLLQSVLVGKAQNAYSSLSPEDSANYETVKQSILRAYELVPEAYRQKFRNRKKDENETYVGFAREKEVLFDRWCDSKSVNRDYESLRQVILLEEFKRCIFPSLHTYLDERKIDNLSEAAKSSDEYSLIHKVNKNQQFKAKVQTLQNKRENEKTYSTSSPQSGSVLTTTLQFQSKPEMHSTSVKLYDPFVSDCTVSIDSSPSVSVKMLRDSGSSQSLILENTLPLSDKTYTGRDVLIKGVGNEVLSIPLHKVHLNSAIINGSFVVGVCTSIPVKDIKFLLGNDIAGGEVNLNPVVSLIPNCDEATENLIEITPGLFPACVTTRSRSKSLETEISELSGDSAENLAVDLDKTFLQKIFENSACDIPDCNLLSKDNLVVLQSSDQSLTNIMNSAVDSKEQLLDSSTGYFYQSGILMRKWRPPTAPANNDWQTVYQIVIPVEYRSDILHFAHETPLGGHLGVNKTYSKILRHFFWPGLKSSVVKFCQTCHDCQVSGKGKSGIPSAPLIPIPAIGEPFSEIICDCVGPLPKTKSGNQYLLTIMCKATRFPEAIPLRKIDTPSICKALVKFFTLFGLPRSLQSDNGSNFMSGIFQQVMFQLGISQSKSSPYHPESQGALERFHQTLKSMLRVYCNENGKDWDEGVHLLLFATRESVQESLGFSPFELVFGHQVRGVLKLLKDHWLSDVKDIPLLKYVSDFKSRLHNAWKCARENLAEAQIQMKHWYDKKSRNRKFNCGDKVLVLFPIRTDSLTAKFHGPYIVQKRLNDVDYLIQTPDRRKELQLCHINMLKPYNEKVESCMSLNQPLVSESYSSVQTVNSLDEIDDDCCEFDNYLDRSSSGSNNVKETVTSDNFLEKISCHLEHLESDEKAQLTHLLIEYKHLFTEKPGLTDLLKHDVDVGNSRPVKQHHYRLNPERAEIMKEEVIEMLKLGVAEPSDSQWSSPCILVSKPGGKWRFVTDYRKVNSLTKTDCFPMPRIDDLIDKIGKAKFVSKFDLNKGYWQVPLTDRAKEISAFVTPDGLYQYKVMPFGMKNSAASFQRLMNKVAKGLVCVIVYLDDIIVFSTDWNEHLEQLRGLFQNLTAANLTINLSKSEFGKATVRYLGHVVGQGHVKPISAKIQTIIDYPVPVDKKSIMRFLGMAGYYRKFCRNFSSVVQPLTNLLKKDVKLFWSKECQIAFESVKSLLTCSPVLLAPDFGKQFKLVVDASDIGAGAVLVQTDENGIEHPVCYYSKKFAGAQLNYSTIEKECLSLIHALSRI
ncbi:uncharacterized protein LOC141904313 [Tubulanus polymorphus]|uniref:uncharacterized protein LOC141904313 n=1 Tax=Tubulanus polymorphus TaxID=672921 RepID=UPI003DA587F8